MSRQRILSNHRRTNNNDNDGGDNSNHNDSSQASPRDRLYHHESYRRRRGGVPQQDDVDVVRSSRDDYDDQYYHDRRRPLSPRSSSNMLLRYEDEVDYDDRPRTRRGGGGALNEHDRYDDEDYDRRNRSHHGRLFQPPQQDDDEGEQRRMRSRHAHEDESSTTLRERRRPRSPSPPPPPPAPAAPAALVTNGDKEAATMKRDTKRVKKEEKEESPEVVILETRTTTTTAPTNDPSSSRSSTTTALRAAPVQPLRRGEPRATETTNAAVTTRDDRMYQHEESQDRRHLRRRSHEQELQRQEGNLPASRTVARPQQHHDDDGDDYDYEYDDAPPPSRRRRSRPRLAAPPFHDDDYHRPRGRHNYLHPVEQRLVERRGGSGRHRFPSPSRFLGRLPAPRWMQTTMDPAAAANMPPQKKQFCLAGPCQPHRHFQLPVVGRLSRLLHAVQEGQYLQLVGPRQVGKTTAALQLARALRQQAPPQQQQHAPPLSFVALRLSVASARGMTDLGQAQQAILESWDLEARIQLEEMEMTSTTTTTTALAASNHASHEESMGLPPIQECIFDMARHGQSLQRPITEVLTRWASICRPRALVLFLDDLDVLFVPNSTNSNQGDSDKTNQVESNDLFHAILNQIEMGHMHRPDHFPHSIVLVRESRTLPDFCRVFVETFPLPHFTKDETLAFCELSLGQAAAESTRTEATAGTRKVMLSDAASRFNSLTQGHPWLVSAFLWIATSPEVQTQHLDLIMNKQHRQVRSLGKRNQQPQKQEKVLPADVSAAMDILFGRMDPFFRHWDYLLRLHPESKTHRTIILRLLQKKSVAAPQACLDALETAGIILAASEFAGALAVNPGGGGGTDQDTSNADSSSTSSTTTTNNKSSTATVPTTHGTEYFVVNRSIVDRLLQRSKKNS